MEISEESLIVFITDSIMLFIVLQVFNGSTDKPYTNPKAPVHIITGSAVSSYQMLAYFTL